MRVSANVGGLVVFLVCVFPVYWMVNTSLLPRREIRSPDPTWLPLGGTLDNYRRVFTGDRFTDALTMSLMVTLATVVVALVVRVPGRGRGDPVPVPRPLRRSSSRCC